MPEDKKYIDLEGMTTIYNDLRARVVGTKGPKGDPGEAGKTPVKGVDYWTTQDVEAINADSKAYVDTLVGPINTTLDEINGEVL